MNDQNVSDEVMEALQRQTFDYFVHEANPLARFFLETGWWAYAAYIVALIAVPWF